MIAGVGAALVKDGGDQTPRAIPTTPGPTTPAPTTPAPTDTATDFPTETPTESPTPTDQPTDQPTDEPTDDPAVEPTDEPDDEPDLPRTGVPSGGAGLGLVAVAALGALGLRRARVA